jgi:hypothetical protein
MVTGDALALVMVATFAALATPTTLVKLKLTGAIFNEAVALPEPVPVRPASRGLKPASWISVSAPLIVPMVVGAKVTAIAQLAFGPRLAVHVVPLPETAKFPLALKLRLMAESRLLVRVMILAAEVLPTETVPKLNEVGVKERG